MRTLTYFVATTIDGFIAGPDGGDPAGTDGVFPVEGDHIDAIVKEYPEVVPGHIRKELGIDPENVRFDTVVEGRRSYEIGLEAGIRDAYPHLRHIVFSRTLPAGPDPSVEIVADDPVEVVGKLKERDGDGIWLCGGSSLAAALATEIDRLILTVHPVLIGTGRPLLDAGFDVQAYTLEKCRTFRSGVVTLSYARAASGQDRADRDRIRSR